jgi:TRAP-type C4-dicarboxylate transport system permease small subunit
MTHGEGLPASAGAVLMQSDTAPPSLALRLTRMASRMARTLLGLVLLGMVVLNVANAIGRYVLGVVFIGADEVLVFAMIWMVMIGVLVVTAEGSHIALDLVAERASPRTRALCMLLHHAVMAGGAGYAAVQSSAFVDRVGMMGQTSMALGMPMTIPHAALVVGFGGTALIAVLLFVRDAMTFLVGASPHEARGR